MGLENGNLLRGVRHPNRKKHDFPIRRRSALAIKGANVLHRALCRFLQSLRRRVQTLAVQAAVLSMVVTLQLRERRIMRRRCNRWSRLLRPGSSAELLRPIEILLLLVSQLFTTLRPLKEFSRPTPVDRRG